MPPSALREDPLRLIAEQVADCFADSGCALVEEGKIDGLAATLRSFLTVAGIPNRPDRDGPFSLDEPSSPPGDG